MTNPIHTATIDHIPAIWLEPAGAFQQRRLVIFLPYLSGSKTDLLPYLSDLSAAGLLALSFDPWGHGERTQRSPSEVAAHTFGNFRRNMWTTLGQTALDALRVIDWAIENLGAEDPVSLGGISMGGDIAVAAAGLDPRVRRVGAVVATPDWLRPGMVDLNNPAHPILDPGTPDAYARALYDWINPITHPEHYAHAPQMRFVCGAQDDHVPPEAASRFQAALAEDYPQAAANLSIDLLPGLDHLGVTRAAGQWWPDLVRWFAAP